MMYPDGICDCRGHCSIFEMLSCFLFCYAKRLVLVLVKVLTE